MEEEHSFDFCLLQTFDNHIPQGPIVEGDHFCLYNRLHFCLIFLDNHGILEVSMECGKPSSITDMNFCCHKNRDE